MKKYRYLCCLFIAFLFNILLFISSGFSISIEESFKNDFPWHEFEKINKSDIKGFYEVIYSTKIDYYIPDQHIFIKGDIINKKGQNVTHDKENKIKLIKYKEIIKSFDLKDFVIIGDGKHNVVEITNPDCHYCSLASEYLNNKINVTRHIVFYSLRNDSDEKLLNILISKNPSATYKNILKGLKESIKSSLDINDRDEAIRRLKKHQNFIKYLGINSTPFFIIDDEYIVDGADIQELEDLLK